VRPGAHARPLSPGGDANLALDHHRFAARLALLFENRLIGALAHGVLNIGDIRIAGEEDTSGHDSATNLIDSNGP